MTLRGCEVYLQLRTDSFNSGVCVCVSVSDGPQVTELISKWFNKRRPHCCYHHESDAANQTDETLWLSAPGASATAPGGARKWIHILRTISGLSCFLLLPWCQYGSRVCYQNTACEALLVCSAANQFAFIYNNSPVIHWGTEEWMYFFCCIYVIVTVRVVIT